MGQELQNGSRTHLEGGAADACAQEVALATVYKYSGNGSDRQCSCLPVAGDQYNESVSCSPTHPFPFVVH